MNKSAVIKLIKDIVIAIIFFVLGNCFFSDTKMASISYIFAYVVMGFPFGWRWSSKIITAITLRGVFMKLCISAAIGWLATPIIIISDTIHCFVRESSK